MKFGIHVLMPSSLGMSSNLSNRNSLSFDKNEQEPKAQITAKNNILPNRIHVPFIKPCEKNPRHPS
jgi:hypothetical protein